MIAKHIYKTYIIGLFLLLATVAKTNASTTFIKGAKVNEVNQNWEFNKNHEFVQTDDTITITLIGGKNDGQIY